MSGHITITLVCKSRGLCTRARKVCTRVFVWGGCTIHSALQGAGLAKIQSSCAMPPMSLSDGTVQTNLCVVRALAGNPTMSCRRKVCIQDVPFVNGR